MFRREIRYSIRFYKCHYGLIQSTKSLGSGMSKHFPVKTVRSYKKFKNHT